MRRLGAADAAEREARSADALEVEIPRKVVTAGAQGFERRRQPGLELDEAADCRRGALAHRYPDALELLVKARGGNALDPHDDPVGALTLFPRLDEASDVH